jgi:WD40 repeat protein
MKNKIPIFLILCSVRLLHAMDKAETENPLLNKPKLLKEVAVDLPQSARFARDGSSLVLGSAACKFLVYDTLNFTQPKFTIPLNYDNFSIDTSPMLPTCAVIGNSSLPASIWNIKEGKKLVDLPDATTCAFTIEYSNDGTQVLTATPQGCQIVDLGTNTVTTVNSSGMAAARFNPIDNNMLACATLCQEQTSSSILSIYDLRTNKPINLANHLPVYGLEFNPEGSKLVSISAFNFGVWDAKKAALVEYLNTKGKEINKPVHVPKTKPVIYADSLAFIPGTNIFLGAIDTGRVTVCDVDKPSESMQFELVKGQAADAFALDISPDGKTLVTGLYEQNKMRIWDISNVKETLKEKYRKSKDFTTVSLPDGSTEYYNIEGDYIITKTPASVIECELIAAPQPPQISHNLGCALT